jgi:fumarate reductase subunit D
MTLRGTAHRRDPLWLAALAHRLSGLALALFLPLHFLALGLALQGEARLQSFIAWSAHPLVKFSEAALVFALAIHLLGGLRLLAIETGLSRGGRAPAALAVATIALALAVLFLVRAR